MELWVRMATDEAVREIFFASGGVPRAINQLALQALIAAAATGCDTIDGAFLAATIDHHPLYARGDR